METKSYEFYNVISYIVYGIIIIVCGLMSLLPDQSSLVLIIAFATLVLLLISTDYYSGKIKKSIVVDEMAHTNLMESEHFAMKGTMLLSMVIALAGLIIEYINPDFNVTHYVYGFVVMLFGIYRLLTGLRFRRLELE